MILEIMKTNATRMKETGKQIWNSLTFLDGSQDPEVDWSMGFVSRREKLQIEYTLHIHCNNPVPIFYDLLQKTIAYPNSLWSTENTGGLKLPISLISEKMRSTNILTQLLRSVCMSASWVCSAVWYLSLWEVDKDIGSLHNWMCPIMKITLASIWYKSALQER